MERRFFQGGSTPKYNYNTEAFKIVSEESAYWLGFLFADGTVRKDCKRFALSLSNKDLDHLKKFREFICPDRPLDVQDKQNAHRLTVCSKVITEDLVSFGCVPSKSLTLKPPTGIPDDMVRHFIRGYFDGDGCIAFTKVSRMVVSFVGTTEFLDFVRDKYKQAGAVCRSNVVGDKNMKAMRWKTESTNDLKVIYKYMYEDSTVFMDRKHEKFKLVMEM